MISSRDRLTETARRESLRVSQGSARKGGMPASAKITGYSQVWTRDSMINLLGAVPAGD